MKSNNQFDTFVALDMDQEGNYMMPQKIFITRRIPDAGIQILLNAGYDVEIYDKSEPLSHQTLLEKVENVDAIISMLSERIDKEVIDHAKNLRVIANYAVGFNNIDIEYALSKKIVVTNTPDVLTEATADLTWALILSVTKRIPEADQFVRSGQFKGWEPMLMLGDDVTDKTLGIIGAGRIGQAVGHRAQGFRMKILYYSTSPKPEFERQTDARYCTPEEIMQSSDILTFHCPLNDQTKHLVNADNIFDIKKGAFIVNTSRGPIIEEKALAKALESGHLGGAGLDVYEFEPEVIPSLLSMKNVVLAPHIGSATKQTRGAMAEMAANNVIAVLSGKKPNNPVNSFT